VSKPQAGLKKIQAEQEAEPDRTLSFEILSTPRDPSRGLSRHGEIAPDQFLTEEVKS